MTTTEKFYIHQTFRGITNIQQTVSDMLNRLITEAKNEGTEENYTELVVHLFPVWTGIKNVCILQPGKRHIRLLLQESIWFGLRPLLLRHERVYAC